MKKNNLYLSLFLIVFLGSFLRIWQIKQLPPSLNWDEVSHGYNAYSILKTGEDEWGVRWPTIFRAYGDYKLPVYIYLTAISEWFFGLNEFAVRLPSAILGVLGVLGVLGLVKELFPKSKGLPIIAAFLLAVEPWGLFLSRVAVEANVALCLIIAGTYFFLKGLKSSWFLVLSSLFFGLSLFTYNSARAFVPLLVASLVSLYWKDMGDRANKGDRGKQMLAGIVFLVFFLGMIFQGLTPAGQARYRWVSLIDEGAIARINEARSQSGLPGVLPRVFYNKGTYFTTQFIKNYLAYFSPQFLFFEGGTHYQFNLPNEGLIYPIQIPFILLGLWQLIKKKDCASKFILFWLLFAPLAGSLTRDSPHTLRGIILLPVPQILTALGIWFSWKWLELKNRQAGFIFLGIYFLFLFLFLGRFWNIYTNSYRTNYSWAWQYGYKETIGFIKENYDQYDKIIITKKYGEPHEFILFYWPWDPEKYRNDSNLIRYFQTNWYWVDGFAKFEFVNDWEVKNVKCQMSNVKCLLVTSPGDYPEGWEKIKTINFLDGKEAFEILEN